MTLEVIEGIISGWPTTDSSPTAMQPTDSWRLRSSGVCISWPSPGTAAGLCGSPATRLGCLWSAIERALDASEWFVLLASPSSAHSHWVNKEITRWIDTASRTSPSWSRAANDVAELNHGCGVQKVDGRIEKTTAKSPVRVR
jgi:hypothetical protein